MVDCHDSRGYGGFGFVGIAIFLLILFAVFAGRHGFGAHGDCNGGWRGVGPADFWAANGLAQAVPGFEAANWKQQALNFGETLSAINQGNYALSKQISDTASAAEIGNLRDQLYEAKARLLQQETIKEVNDRFCALGAQVADIRCNMLSRPRVEPLVGLPDLGCTNAGFGRRSGLGDCNC